MSLINYRYSELDKSGESFRPGSLMATPSFVTKPGVNICKIMGIVAFAVIIF